ncbi:MAG: peptidylprolyl isomerase [Saprospiraceae bacterium]
MKKILYLFSVLIVLSLFSSCNGDDHTYVEIECDFGKMKVMLYNTTPLHRDNFIKLAKEGFFDDLLFHRVIKGFMAQGGDPQSRGSVPGSPLGAGGPGYTLPAEIGAPHLKGALSAARQGDQVNPQKESSGSQFYVVHGTVQNDASLDKMESLKGFKYNEEQRRLYKTIGGTPQLDMDYTVFGEVVEGLDVIDKICEVKTNPANRPLEDVKMKIRVLN